MSSNRLIFIVLGIIFLVVVILSSQRIATTLRGWFGKYIPAPKSAQIGSATPTPTPPKGMQVSPTPKQFVSVGQSTPSNQIPATGPESVAWILLGGSFASGVLIRRKK